MASKREQLPVIFKRDSDGEITAYFPTLPGNNSPFTCACYAHIGQHSAASEAYAAIRPNASPKEYAPLLAELTGIYADCDLIVRKRFAAAYLNRRRAVLAA